MKVNIWKVVLGLVIVALLVGGGVALYQAGYAHGVMSDVSFEEMHQFSGEYAPMMRHGYRGHMGFFPLGRLLFGGLIFFLIFGAIFRCFGMRHYWASHRMGHAGEGGPPWMRRHPHWDKMPPEEEGEEKTEE